MRAPARRRARLSGAQRREQLLDIAADLILDEGLAALTMERVALRAGVSRGLGYVYFDHRDDLLDALLARETGQLATAVESAMKGARGLEAMVRAAVGAYFDVMQGRGALLARLTQEPALRTPAAVRQRAGHAPLEDIFSQLVAAQTGASPTRAAAYVRVLLQVLPATANAYLNGAVDRSQVEQIYLDMVLGAISRIGPDQPHGVATEQDLRAHERGQ